MKKFDSKDAPERFDEILALVDAGKRVRVTQPDGRAVVVLLEDDYQQLLADVQAATGHKP